MVEVVDKHGIKYVCYNFTQGGDERIYGVCYHLGDSGFTLIPYEDIRPVNSRILAEGNTHKTEREKL